MRQKKQMRRFFRKNPADAFLDIKAINFHFKTKGGNES